jgi:hypothetical protein
MHKRRSTEIFRAADLSATDFIQAVGTLDERAAGIVA